MFCERDGDEQAVGLPEIDGAFLGFGMQASVCGQTVPTDLLDLSIEELFDANVVSEADRVKTQNRWHLSYTYAVSEYDEYYLGTHSVSYDEVLFTPGVDTRSENNYPVVPTEIMQEVHAVRLAYDLTHATSLPASGALRDAEYGSHLDYLGLRRFQYQL